MLLLVTCPFQSCDKDDDLMTEEVQLRSTYGQWKFEGLATHDIETGLSNNKQSYSLNKLNTSTPIVLSLSRDGTYSLITPTGEISGEFSFNFRGAFSFTKIDSSNYIQQSAKNQYVSYLENVTSYSVFEKTLHLYYLDRTHFMLFSSVENKTAH